VIAAEVVFNLGIAQHYGLGRLSFFKRCCLQVDVILGEKQRSSLKHFSDYKVPVGSPPDFFDSLVGNLQTKGISSGRTCIHRLKAGFEQVEVHLECFYEAFVLLLVQQVVQHLQANYVCVVAALIETRFRNYS